MVYFPLLRRVQELRDHSLEREYRPVLDLNYLLFSRFLLHDCNTNRKFITISSNRSTGKRKTSQGGLFDGCAASYRGHDRLASRCSF